LISAIQGFDVSGQFNYTGYTDELRLMLADEWKQEDIDSLIENLNGLPTFDAQTVEDKMM